MYGDSIGHIGILEIFVVFKFLRFSHHSIYGIDAANLESVNIRHGECIIVE